MKMSNNNKNASQRIEDLEAQVASLLVGSDNMAQDVMRMKEALKLLVNKVDAVVKAVNQGGHITDEILDKFMLENQINELKNKVDTMVKAGVLTPSEAVQENSLVVIRELDPNGQVTAVRNQFAFSTLVPMYKEKLLGAKVGASIAIGDAGDSIEILEIYNIAQPQEAAPAAETPADSSAPAAGGSAQPAESASQSSASSA
jgi:hypothetical protein